MHRGAAQGEVYRVTNVLGEGQAVAPGGRGAQGAVRGCEPLADPTVCSACSPLAVLTTPCSPSWAASTAGPWVSCPLSPSAHSACP